MKIYVGVKKTGQWEVFKFIGNPTTFSHGDKYTSVIGPFVTMRGARYMAKYGANNIHLQTVSDAERIAKKENPSGARSGRKNPKPVGSNIPIGTTFLYKNVYITKNPGGYRVRGIVGYEFYYLADAKKNISSWLKSGRYVIHNNAIVTKLAKRNPSGLIYRGIKITKRANKYYYGAGVPYAFRIQAEIKDYIDDKLDRGRAVVSARQGLILI